MMDLGMNDDCDIDDCYIYDKSIRQDIKKDINLGKNLAKCQN